MDKNLFLGKWLRCVPLGVREELDNDLQALIANGSTDIIELEKERMEWALKKFPEATPRSSMKKLQTEIKEVLKEIAKLEKFPDGDNGLYELTEEYADCLMCLFDSAGRSGVQPEDIFDEFAEKLRINKERTWKKNKDNTYSHI